MYSHVDHVEQYHRVMIDYGHRCGIRAQIDKSTHYIVAHCANNDVYEHHWVDSVVYSVEHKR